MDNFIGMVIVTSMVNDNVEKHNVALQWKEYVSENRNCNKLC